MTSVNCTSFFRQNNSLILKLTNGQRKISCFFKFHLKVGVEESIVNAPQITDHGSAV
jgi:hypothetical protein